MRRDRVPVGADQILILGRHPDRTALACELGATDVVSERGDEAVQRVLELTDGFGIHSVLECVGLEDAMRTAIAPPGGAVGRVGVPQVETIPASLAANFANVTVGGGLAPVHASVEELLPDVLEGESNRAGSSTGVARLDEVPDSARAMNDREAIKIMVQP